YFGGRYVFNIAEIQVLNAATSVPEPGSLALLLAPVAALWGRRRGRAIRDAVGHLCASSLRVL
ncbi:MAG: PEP-CTERM sorting domain-containing protein, partial [Acidisphaera sp.]|nr:PEP-CTERM sorting domain-containing protein [Acidisphaera sp.]